MKEDFVMKYTHTARGDQKEIQSYLYAIKEETLLTATEECSLAEAIAGGDKNALSRMIQANLRLVVKIAQDYVGGGLTLDDLIGEGNLGLIRAAEQFEPRYGTRFSTYASFWIKQSIRQALTNSTAMIRLPAHVVALLCKWRKAERALARDLARAPSFNEVASSLGLSETQKLLMTKAQRARQVKLESTVARDAGRWSPVESFDPCGPPDLALQSLEDKRLLQSRLECLDDRERIVLSLRYGLDDKNPMSLREIGSRFGMTREWVRKIELKAIQKLRDEQTSEPSELLRCSRTTNARWRAGEVVAPRARRRSRRSMKTKAKTLALSRKAGGALPSAPAIPVTMTPSVWDGRWSAMNIAIPWNELDSLSTS
jgi:RNA polymerase primary sigma factor